MLTRTRSVLVACSALALSVVPAAAVNMTMEATNADGGAIRLCVGLDSTGQKVAGTQNDLVWDGACASLKKDSCAAVADAKKPLHGNTPPSLPNTYRALVFALDNVDPIRDGALYCCDFEITKTVDCCSVKFDRLGASDPTGHAQATTGVPPQLCLGGAAAPAAPAVPPPAAQESTPAAGVPWLWVGLIGVAVVIAVLLAMRKKS
ncbi:MAG: hypothetical protein ABI629_25445 [bacterium]